ncbi:MAG TPA: rhomboid family intramembrane serine protease [Planctomycetota bacterium]|nr:rhomboid family intramembrane serine protease [Planctomycetota bacterium]
MDMPPWEDTSADTDRETRPRRLTAVNLLILLHIAGFVATGFLTRSNADALAFLEFSPREAVGDLRLWQFVTYPFVQVIRLWFPFAFIPAAYGLFTLGGELEARVGARRILVTYLALSAYGALAHAAWQYLAVPGSREIRTEGLLAPAYGMLLLAALRFPERPLQLLFVFPVRTLTGILFLGIVLLAFCALWFPAGAASILGAAAVAVAIDRLEGRLDRHRQDRQARRERDRFLADIETRRRVDQILEKISREGMASLTGRERRILREGSELARRERGTPHE